MRRQIYYTCRLYHTLFRPSYSEEDARMSVNEVENILDWITLDDFPRERIKQWLRMAKKILATTKDIHDFNYYMVKAGTEVVKWLYGE